MAPEQLWHVLSKVGVHMCSHCIALQLFTHTHTHTHAHTLSPSFHPMASSGSSGCQASAVHSVTRTLGIRASLLGSRGRP